MMKIDSKKKQQQMIGYIVCICNNIRPGKSVNSGQSADNYFYKFNFSGLLNTSGKFMMRGGG